MNAALRTWGIATSGALALAQAAAADAAVGSADDLPRHTYALSTEATELSGGGPELDRLLGAVREDIERDLATYDIQDATTLKKMYATLAAIALLEARDADAIALYTKLRELEEKPADRWMSGAIGTAIARARIAGGAADPDYPERVGEYVRARLAEAPWELVQENVQGAKGQLEMLGEGLLVGIIENQIQPAIDASPEISGQLAAQLINTLLALDVLLEVKEPIVAELTLLVDANRTEREDIWPERQVTLSPRDDLTPVVVAVWDTGVDPSVFEGRLFVNEAETIDGEDDDGNGYVDDVHGIAFDVDAVRDVPILYPLGEDAGRLPELRARLEGLFDLQAALPTEAADALRADMASMTPDEVPQHFSDLMRFALYVHGTHVAGIAVEGNPFARVLVARLTADHRMVPPAPTLEESRRTAEMFRDVVAYFRAHDVRVVNMSWVIQFTEIEGALERNGVGASAEERAELAREIFAVQSDALEEAMRSAPEILFVGGAGNSNDDVSFNKIIPPAFDLPNHIAVGAVDESGRATSFTSFGEAVDLYASGFEVESYVPGGERMRLSGTSMASPQAANLAAKLIALDPSLTPEEVIDLMRRGADHAGDSQPLRVINPRRSVELLHASAH